MKETYCHVQRFLSYDILDQVAITPNGYQTKWLLDQMAIRPSGNQTKWALDKVALDQLTIDELAIRPNGIRQSGKSPKIHEQTIVWLWIPKLLLKKIIYYIKNASEINIICMYSTFVFFQNLSGIIFFCFSFFFLRTIDE